MVIDMDEANRLRVFFQTLGDANRLRIIRFIALDERSVSEIVDATGLSQPLVSHHLRTLKKHGILETKRDGPFIFYQLKNSKLLDVLTTCSEIAPDIDAVQVGPPPFPFPGRMRRFKGKK